MSRCRFCGAELADASAPCPACGEKSVPPPHAGSWWTSNATVIVALALLGPFALPLVWAHPRYKVVTKVVLTAATVGVTIWAYFFTRNLVRHLADLIEAAGS